MSYALLVRNALACETAKHSACRCKCGGQFHGQKHTADWIAKTWTEIEAEVTRLRDAAASNMSPAALYRFIDAYDTRAAG